VELLRGSGVDPSGDVIVHRAVRASKWMLYLSASALAAGFCTNILLARIGPVALGFYGLLMLIVSVINTFFVLGGPNVIVNYLPKTPGSLKGAFLLQYAVVVVLFSASCLALGLVFPGLIRLMFGSHLQVPVIRYMGLLLPILVLQFLVWGVLQADLRFRVLAVSQNSISWFYCLLIAGAIGVGALGPGRVGDHSAMLVMIVAVANGLAILVGVFFVRVEGARSAVKSARLSFPQGFWTFVLTLHAGTLLNFMVTNAGPLFVVQNLTLADLGYFRAVAVLAQFVGWVPMVLDRSFYPTVCELVRSGKSVDRFYERFARLYLTTSSFIALVLMLFSRELLAVFGRSFSDAGFVLLELMCAAGMLCAPLIYLNFALVTAHQKTVHTMGAYAVGAASAILFYGVLVQRYGLVGVGVAHLLLQLVMLGAAILLARRFTDVPFPTRSYLIAGCALVIGLTGSLLWPEPSIAHVAFRAGMLGVFVVLASVLRLLTPRECAEMLEALAPRRMHPSPP
jgi:O-antigen/teichoic acid export membrane protein